MSDEQQHNPDHDIAVGVDPTETVLGESALNEKALCDYNINTAVGCRHGCTFCYVPSSPQVRTRAEMLNEEVGVENPQLEWGQYVLHRPDETADALRGRLERKQTWKETPKGQGIVAMSFGTDCYMDDPTAEITTTCLDTLLDQQRPNGEPIYVRILTRSPLRAYGGQFEMDSEYEGTEFLEVFRRGAAADRVTVGSSIPSLDPNDVLAIEPKAPPPEARLRGLERFAEAGVQTFVSMSPTYPTQDKADLRELLTTLDERAAPEVIFHEPINHRGGNFGMMIEAAREAGNKTLAAELDKITDQQRWARYALDHLRWVQEIADEENIDVYLWPDGELLNVFDTQQVEAWVNGWWEQQPPEAFAGRPLPEEKPQQMWL